MSHSLQPLGHSAAGDHSVWEPCPNGELFNYRYSLWAWHTWHMATNTSLCSLVLSSTFSSNSLALHSNTCLSSASPVASSRLYRRREGREGGREGGREAGRVVWDWVRGFLQKISSIQASFYHILSMPAINIVRGSSHHAHCIILLLVSVIHLISF